MLRVTHTQPSNPDHWALAPAVYNEGDHAGQRAFPIRGKEPVLSAWGATRSLDQLVSSEADTDSTENEREWLCP